MITKIISGGQTGADRAALAVAMEEGIPHGAWIPKGRKTEAGPLPDRYQLNEMPTDSYPERTEQNVIDSDGTLIISHGELTGGSLNTREMSKKHDKLWMHINLNKVNVFKAAENIATWVAEHEIRVLNVAGPKVSKDPQIYEEVRKVLTTALHLDSIRTHMPDPERLHPHLPGTVDEAIKNLLSKLPLKDKTMIARMTEDELTYLHTTLGQHIRNRFGLSSQNRSLMQSCRLQSGQNLNEDECSEFIVKELWTKLRATHGIRAVK
jgi:hypothetical protein